MRTDRRTPDPIPEPRCDGCGRPGVSHTLSVCKMLRPHQHSDRAFCPRCWITLVAMLDTLLAQLPDIEQTSPD